MFRFLFKLLLFIIVALILRAALSEPVEEEGKCLAVIRIQGPLYGTTVDSLTGRSKGADEIMRQIIAARQDENVAGVLFRIDSPGGSVTAAEEIAREIKKLKATGKVTVTSMGDMAASAGYWLASCTDYIFANASTLTGSIGVYIPYTNIEELYNKIGISSERIKSGEYKDILSAERQMTDKERQLLQNIVDEMHGSFISQVAEGRGMPEQAARGLADGRIYTGRQAKDLKLVDEIGNYYDALSAAARRAQLPGEPRIKNYDRPFTWRDILQMGMWNELAGLFRPGGSQEGLGIKS